MITLNWYRLRSRFNHSSSRMQHQLQERCKLFCRRIQSRTSSSEACGPLRSRWTPACSRSGGVSWEPRWQAAVPGTSCETAAAVVTPWKRSCWWLILYNKKRWRNWRYLMEELSSSISSRSLLTSSCNCCLSCWSFPMCSTVFCNVTALVICMHEGRNWKREKVKQKYHHSSPLIFHRGNQTLTLTFDWVFRVGTRLQSVLKPMLMWLRLFCSEDMCVDLWPCHTASVETLPKGTQNTDFSFLCICLYFLYLYSMMDFNYSQFRNRPNRDTGKCTNLFLFILYQRCTTAADQRCWTWDLI